MLRGWTVMLGELLSWRSDLVLRVRYDRSFRRALFDYCGVFREILAQMHGAGAESELRIGVGWDHRLESFNAVARSGCSPSVRLRVGCFSQLQGAANLLFRQPDLFVSVGDPSMERGEDDGSERESDSPRCPVRREASIIVAELGLVLIFLHEIAHHVLGHLDLDKRRGLQAVRREACTEAVLRRGSPEETERQRAEELEADRFAYLYVTGLAAQDDPPFAKQLIRVPSLRQSLFELAVYAHTIVVCSFGGAGWSLARFENLPHPHPVVRLVASQSTLQELGVSEERCRAVLRESAALVARAWSRDSLESLVGPERGRVGDLCAHLRQRSLDLSPLYRRYDFGRGAWVEPGSEG